MSIHMSKMEFFWSRPTVVALIGFGFDLSTASFVENDKNANTLASEKSDSEKVTNDESGRIEGLLGYGKDRVVFYLNMNVDSVTVFLNKEYGSQLVMFVQERFVLDIKARYEAWWYKFRDASRRLMEAVSIQGNRMYFLRKKGRGCGRWGIEERSTRGMVGLLIYSSTL